MKCNFCKPFILIFMQNDGGVPPADISPFHSGGAKDANSCKFIAHSLCSFMLRRKLNPFVFKQFRTLCQKQPGVGSGKSVNSRLGLVPLRVAAFSAPQRYLCFCGLIKRARLNYFKMPEIAPSSINAETASISAARDRSSNTLADFTRTVS